MLFLKIFLTFILGLFFLLLILKTSVYIKLSHPKSENSNILLRIYFYNKKLGFNIPIRKKDIEKDAEKVEKLEKETFINRTKKALAKTKLLKQTHYKSKYVIRSRINIEHIKCVLEFGFSNAAKTGIATGAAWSVLYNVLSFLTRIFNVYDHIIDVRPNFEKEKFEIYLEGIISFRIANIIFIILVYFSNYLALQKEQRGKTLKNEA